MYNHAPPGYRCPFCAIAAGLEADYCYTSAEDVVLRTDHVTGFIIIPLMAKKPRACHPDPECPSREYLRPA